MHCGLPGEGFDVTEAGTQKRLAVWIVRDPAEVERIATLGPDVLALTRDEFAALLATTGARIKTVLTDQRIIAGIGNAYSDEILHTAKLSPFATSKNLSDDQIDLLHATIHSSSPVRSADSKAKRLPGSKARNDLVCGCTPGLGCRARYAGTPCGRSRSPTARSSTARRARPVARSWRTGGCRDY